MAIYTAGYEGLSIDAFIARLKQAQIDKVLDVREYPLSRKPGFSKKAFAQCLADAGIAYEHSPPLGAQNRFETAIRSMAIGGSMRATSGLTSVPGWTFWRT